MRRSLRLSMVLAILAPPAWSVAHTGGPLDSDGCHADRRLGGHHCHRGKQQSPLSSAVTPAASVADGSPPAIQEKAAPAPSPLSATTEPTPAATAKPLQTQREFQERLRTIDALYKEGLLTKEEYEAKRKAVLDQL